ncbi:hypothetical protein B9T29_06425 [Acinetobacter sp. ANC 3903]|uniref:hypothetical protein n=1 Tax=Acinetobacter sp. ANC 3903 TaxID=1977883 RepID=UPI000A32F6BA|nr:hypothetical protein [Acinetobacter sp. ANC 3903]OTG62852.1 hypothetical protein B9T29_06425 [Acinetobacter sp. ANC 3903]
MATDVDVQFFSHLNGLVLGNNWGDLIRLLDKVLVTGIDFTQITAASIDAQGDLTLTFYAAHNALLFQIMELSGFAASELNQKYRIKGVPNTTQLILKPSQALTVSSVSTLGTAKLAPLGYDIIFRDNNDVKRVYRAKNPRAEHPFIRVDETISDGTNSYTSTYTKCAMVGLLESMEHIDDYQNPNVLQLPFDPNNLQRNWKITGTGSSVVRGWCKWQWAGQYDTTIGYGESQLPAAGSRAFTIFGDSDAFYFLRAATSNVTSKLLGGCGLFNNAHSNSIIPNWFLMATTFNYAASSSNYLYNYTACMPLAVNANTAKFHAPNFNETARLSASVLAAAVIPDYNSGSSSIYSSNTVAALEIPMSDDSKFLRGSLKHLYYNGKSLGNIGGATPSIYDNSMYVVENIGGTTWNGGSVLFYLGELE